MNNSHHGELFLGRKKETNSFVVIKEIDPQFHMARDNTELRFISGFQSPQLIRLLDVLSQAEEQWVCITLDNQS